MNLNTEQQQYRWILLFRDLFDLCIVHRSKEEWRVSRRRWLSSRWFCCAWSPCWQTHSSSWLDGVRRENHQRKRWDVSRSIVSHYDWFLVRPSKKHDRHSTVHTIKSKYHHSPQVHLLSTGLHHRDSNIQMCTLAADSLMWNEMHHHWSVRWMTVSIDWYRTDLVQRHSTLAYRRSVLDDLLFFDCRENICRHLLHSYLCSKRGRGWSTRTAYRSLTLWTKESAPIDNSNRCIELWWLIESIDEEIRETGIDRFHLDMHRDG